MYTEVREGDYTSLHNTFEIPAYTLYHVIYFDAFLHACKIFCDASCCRVR
ncbi:hypothetical protein WN51_06384 [Melipona quadrifasciata]|uniref:Uncharacterized protein n=1 Tax=Melipona quadrifasciata TaxID=166423 RepID=A0A0N0BK51_9HYME|nr:hypothetical protein WN51_06384 [Melipona quadrifasciata]